MPRPERPLVAWIGSDEGDVSLVGGKALSLIRLAAYGFRVPPGFCLTTEAFERQLAAIPSVSQALGGLPDEDAREALTRAFESEPLEASVAEALATALGRLAAELAAIDAGPARLAVRSSGMGEDSSAASFAGLHETELGVAPPDVAGAVRRCWASLWSAAAVAYRRRRGLAMDGGGMAVVVQSLVPADAAAVVFTRHPVTGRTDQLVVTGVRGLGDAMVSGTVTPDTWVIDRATGGTAEYTPGDRRAGHAGPSIDPLMLAALTDLSLSVEREFAAPVDIEAAAAAGAWYLLQARPITT